MNVWAVVLLCADLFSLGVRPIDTGAASGTELSATACGSCHKGEYEEWQRSRHRMAWTNGLFQHDYRQGPRAWCRNCHAPLSAQQKDIYQNRLAEEGVNCVACHVRDGVMLARIRRAGSPHETRASADFGSPSYCAGCHQFNFPVFAPGDLWQRYTDEPMQNTVAQFAKLAAAGDLKSCMDCHGSKHNHAFLGSHSLDMLRGALALSMCRDGTRLSVRVDNRGAGHNVPTGDVHRHMVVRVWRSTAPEFLQDMFMGRRFELAPGNGKKTVWDSTVPPKGSRTFAVGLGEIGGEADEPINVELRYIYGVSEAPEPPIGEKAYQTVYLVRQDVGAMAGCQ